MKKVILSDFNCTCPWSNKAIAAVLERKGMINKVVFVDRDTGRMVSREEFEKANEVWTAAYDGKTFCYDFARDDEDAIAVLEEYGSEYCSEKYTTLRIETFDETIYKWGIGTYDTDDGDREYLELYPILTASNLRRIGSVEGIIEMLRKADMLEPEHSVT